MYIVALIVSILFGGIILTLSFSFVCEILRGLFALLINSEKYIDKEYERVIMQSEDYKEHEKQVENLF